MKTLGTHNVHKILSLRRLLYGFLHCIISPNSLGEECKLLNKSQLILQHHQIAHKHFSVNTSRFSIVELTLHVTGTLL